MFEAVKGRGVERPDGGTSRLTNDSDTDRDDDTADNTVIVSLDRASAILVRGGGY